MSRAGEGLMTAIMTTDDDRVALIPLQMGADFHAKTKDVPFRSRATNVI
jgi:hypothetical protein